MWKKLANKNIWAYKKKVKQNKLKVKVASSLYYTRAGVKIPKLTWSHRDYQAPDALWWAWRNGLPDHRRGPIHRWCCSQPEVEREGRMSDGDRGRKGRSQLRWTRFESTSFRQYIGGKRHILKPDQCGARGYRGTQASTEQEFFSWMKWMDWVVKNSLLVP